MNYLEFSLSGICFGKRNHLINLKTSVMPNAIFNSNI